MTGLGPKQGAYVAPWMATFDAALGVLVRALRAMLKMLLNLEERSPDQSRTSLVFSSLP